MIDRFAKKCGQSLFRQAGHRTPGQSFGEVPPPIGFAGDIAELFSKTLKKRLKNQQNHAIVPHVEK